MVLGFLYSSIFVRFVFCSGVWVFLVLFVVKGFFFFGISMKGLVKFSWFYDSCSFYLFGLRTGRE